MRTHNGPWGLLAAALCVATLSGCSAAKRDAQITGYERVTETSVRVWFERDAQESIVDAQAAESPATITISVQIEGPDDGAWTALEDSLVIELTDPVGDRDIVTRNGDGIPLRR